MKEISVLCSVFMAGELAAAPVPAPGLTVLPGRHCESSAIINALRASGYDVSEDEIIGGSGALSFIFIKGDFPFIGARTADIKANFFDAAGIAWHAGAPKGKDAGIEDLESLVVRGIAPVLRVDMRFLPYRYGGKIGPACLSFGSHYIALFSVDRSAGFAYVSDTGYPGLQKIRLEDLQRARTSKTKNFPPRAEFYWVERAIGPHEPSPAPKRADLDALVRASLDRVAENYETSALDNLSRFGGDLSRLGEWCPKKYLHQAVLAYMAGNVEDYGTGGASFRMLYREFVVRAASDSSYPGIAALLPALDASIADWHELSRAFLGLSQRVKTMGDAERRMEFAGLGEIADRLYGDEKAFYAEVKRMHAEIGG